MGTPTHSAAVDGTPLRPTQVEIIAIGGRPLLAVTTKTAAAAACRHFAAVVPVSRRARHAPRVSVCVCIIVTSQLIHEKNGLARAH